MSWKSVKIGDFLKRSKIPIDIEDNQSYKRVTIRTKHQGVSVRDTEIGKKIGTKKQFILKKGQFILSKIDARYGAFGIAPDEVDGSIITGNFWAYDVDDRIMNINWFHHYTNSPIFYDLCERASSGITHRKYLDEDFFLNYSLFIPEVSEQDGHVIFIEDRKSRIGNLENEQIYQLDILKKLRQQILQDAVQGKLVLQKPDDEPASVLLERIKVGKEKLVREKKIKKEKPLPQINPEEVPFEIPDSWVWCRLGELIELISGQDLRPNQYSDTEITGTPYITGASNLDDEKVIINRWTKNPKSIAIDGDLLITCKGSGVGKMAYLSEKSVHIARQIMAIRSRYLPVKYVKRVLEINVLTYKSKAKSLIPGIDRETVLNTYFPLPPQKEQNRIVTKIEQLMKLCDELVHTIQQNQNYTQKLLQVALKEALDLKQTYISINDNK